MWIITVTKATQHKMVTPFALITNLNILQYQWVVLSFISHDPIILGDSRWHFTDMVQNVPMKIAVIPPCWNLQYTMFIEIKHHTANSNFTYKTFFTIYGLSSNKTSLVSFWFQDGELQDRELNAHARNFPSWNAKHLDPVEDKVHSRMALKQKRTCTLICYLITV